MKYAPGWEKLNCCGLLTGPAKTRRWLWNPGTVGLPEDAAPRKVVAEAPEMLDEKDTVGGVA